MSITATGTDDSLNKPKLTSTSKISVNSFIKSLEMFKRTNEYFSARKTSFSPARKKKINIVWISIHQEDFVFLKLPDLLKLR